MHYNHKDVSMFDQSPISLILTRAEALILEDVCSRLADHPASRFAHSAERYLLLSIATYIENALPERFAPNYADLLHAAQQTIQAEYEE